MSPASNAPAVAAVDWGSTRMRVCLIDKDGKLAFDRETTRGLRLDIPAGTAVRFEPGQTRTVRLIPFTGKREIYGFRQSVMGKL